MPSLKSTAIKKRSYTVTKVDDAIPTDVVISTDVAK